MTEKLVEARLRNGAARRISSPFPSGQPMCGLGPCPSDIAAGLFHSSNDVGFARSGQSKKVQEWPQWAVSGQSAFVDEGKIAALSSGSETGTRKRRSNAASRSLTLLPYCPTALLPYCPTALLPYCPTALLPYCTTALLPYCPTALLPYCPTALLPYCPHFLRHRPKPQQPMMRLVAVVVPGLGKSSLRLTSR
jgi:hypothetical protein